jgi:glycogen debranching enzyme
LFLMAYGEAFRWGAPRSAIEALLPSARAALAWLRGPGDPDGDGFLEYVATGPRSLRNQGWKDSVNGVQFADGNLAEGPIAIVEAQGYACRGRLELAGVLRSFGEDGEADELEAEADVLRSAIRDRFWMPGRDGAPGAFAMALDGDKRQVDAIASNMAHLLWCGVPSPEEASDVVEHLLSPELSSGWGLRTLSSAMAGYNPVSYHTGSVWPHDTAIACEGMRRYGFTDQALRLAGSLIDALALFDLRLPELYGGHTRGASDAPIPYPTACRPQAWAAGVALSLEMTFLDIVPRLGEGRIAISPALPVGIDVLTVADIPFPTGRLSIKVEQGGATEILAAPGWVVIEVVAS